MTKKNTQLSVDNYAPGKPVGARQPGEPQLYGTEATFPWMGNMSEVTARPDSGQTKSRETTKSGWGDGQYIPFPWMKPQEGSGQEQQKPAAQTPDYAQTLKEAYDAQATARAQALEQMLGAYEGQKQQLDTDYNRAASQAYANARLSAIGNNEALAANGLAGGVYQHPTSGYSETSRVAQDNALRYNLGEVELARVKAKKEVEDDINALRAQGMGEQADLLAQQAESLINLQMQLDEQRYQRAVDAANILEDKSYYKKFIGAQDEDDFDRWWWDND